MSKAARVSKAASNLNEGLAKLLYGGQPRGAVDLTTPEHQKIERAYAYAQLQQAQQQAKHIKIKADSINRALDELQKVSPRLYEIATAKPSEDEVITFPRRLRVPTETLPKGGWDYRK